MIKKVIDNCINYKMIPYFRFLMVKIVLKKIKHRKIAQKIFTDYIPNN